MRLVQLFLIVFLAALMPIQGSRLRRLEEDVNALKSFMFRELGSIRDQVNEISIRVETLENSTATSDPGSPNRDMDIFSYNLGDKTGESGKKLKRAGNNDASYVVTDEVQNMRKAYSNDKKELHKLKQDVKNQLRELEQKITSHMDNLTADVQHNIEYIHENISLANITLSDVINGSISNISILSDNIKKEIKRFIENTSRQLTLQFNKTESKLKDNISSTFHHNEDNLERFMTLADRNVSEMILKADNIFSLLRTNFSEMPNQITNLLLDLQTVSLNIQHVEEKQNHLFVLTCNEDFSVNNGTIQDGYYYPCARDIRLANASTYRFIGVQGRLEVRYDNSWGTVCDDTFEKGIRNTNVKVVCRMFGFRECDCVREAGLGEGSGVIWMDDVECGGGESSILNCHHRGWGSNNCGHSEDVGIQLWN
ncbi:uncharacterized protein LOC128222265 [Mya arenaria]|uniref:uncharacterized protein LOC128222265 n=1 Tax=Mya arenaria TaxID=6604 RepID=UPI0022E50724|nr:uncharacterized protein LOC128222265 [Mya arenaria]